MRHPTTFRSAREPSPLSCLLALALVFSGEGQAAEQRRAVLVVERDEVCVHGGRPDHMLSIDRVEMQLPAADGPVSASGAYGLTGTSSGGYQLSGRSEYHGRIEGKRLTLDSGRWFYAGKAMTSSAPEMPSAEQPVPIHLEDGAEQRIDFENAHAEIAPCSGAVVYRIEMDEIQRWRIVLAGHRSLIYKDLMFVSITGQPRLGALDFEHGATFRYALAATVTLEKQNGAWRYASGRIDKAAVSTRYEQVPVLYDIVSSRCPICTQLGKLEGQTIPGSLSGGQLKLGWPNRKPVLGLHSKLRAGCAKTKHRSTCLGLKEGAQAEFVDRGFFDVAAGHALPLVEGRLPARRQTSATDGYALEYVYDYTLERLP